MQVTQTEQSPKVVITNYFVESVYYNGSNEVSESNAPPTHFENNLPRT
jgi:hypothetical protein